MSWFRRKPRQLTTTEMFTVLVDIHSELRHIREGIRNMNNDVENLRKALDAATTAIAARFQHYIDEIKALQAVGSPPSADQLAAIQADIDRLTAMGTDPADPVGAVPPAPTDPVATPPADPGAGTPPAA
jgi:hypothetical protein